MSDAELGVVLILAGVVVCGVEPGAGAPAATSRVIDRTFSCSMDLQAGVCHLYAAAQTLPARRLIQGAS